MTQHWQARQAFDPTEEYEWVFAALIHDTSCVWCGLAMADGEYGLFTYVFSHEAMRLFVTTRRVLEADWDEGLVWAHTDCPGAGSQVTVRTSDDWRR